MSKLGEALCQSIVPLALFGEIVRTAEDEHYACPNCDYKIDSCHCVCPYCAENEACGCAIGHDKATGG